MAAPKPDAAFLAEVRARRLKELEMHRVLRQIAAYCVFLAFTLFLAHQSIDKRSIYIKNDLLATLFRTKPYFRKVSILFIMNCNRLGPYHNEQPNSLKCARYSLYLNFSNIDVNQKSSFMREKKLLTVAGYSQ